MAAHAFCGAPVLGNDFRVDFIAVDFCVLRRLDSQSDLVTANTKNYHADSGSRWQFLLPTSVSGPTYGALHG